MKKLTTDEMHRLSVEEFRASEKLPLTVVLDNVRSQNNIGSVFRTADAFRVEHIALCGICSTPPHREIHKTALGAEDSVEWSYHEDTAECIRHLKERGYKVFAVEQVDDSVKLNSEIEIHNSKLAIVFGNEIEGVQESLLPLCDGSLEIPQYGTKHSLNVSCAAAIVIWEMFKKFTI
ncbi:MAG: RNA methyltransferase [Bacteroidales bacterium]|nr:RNA methyltransferase [Bacteroidales bacterium]